MGKVSLLKQYQLGDMLIQYYIDKESKNVELMLLPEHMEAVAWDEKNQVIDSLVQLKLVGDIYCGAYSGGGTMRQSESTLRLRYKSQQEIRMEGRTEIRTKVFDQRGYEVEHCLVWHHNNQSVEMYSEFKNLSEYPTSIEMISSFSLGGITPFIEKDGYDSIMVHRLRSVWSMEGRLESKSVEELQLEPSWAGHAIRSERFGQVGSMAVNHYFPYLVVEDIKNEVYWGAQLAHNSSWQMELYRKDDGLAMSGGIADREFGHWMKVIAPGKNFHTPVAILSVCQGGGIDKISQRLTQAGKRFFDGGPECEMSLPVMFNEYCTTWGCPSHENIMGILNVIKGKGFEYFVIDAGWYREDGIPWDLAMGDYNVSTELFPEGLHKTTQAIREAGLKPGIWFEIENVGEKSRAYQLEKHLLKRDENVLTTSMRRFWDMRDPWVQGYLTDKVIGTLKTYGFEYMKIDYNETIGIGCDGAESLGEGLRDNMMEGYNFIEKVKQEVPGIILENCASGGHRLEPLMMRTCSMASFSDAHECKEIPIIAANMHRVILPCQSQIWAVIRKEDDLKRIAYSVASTFLGRMCISGDVINIKDESWELIDKGIAFYKRIAPIIKEGFTYRFGTPITSYRHPLGWQGILRTGENGDAFVLIHTFGGVLEDCVIELPWGMNYTISEIYSDSDVDITITENGLFYQPSENWKAVAVYLS